MDWLYLLAVQGTLRSLLQHHSSIEAIGGGGNTKMSKILEEGEYVTAAEVNTGVKKSSLFCFFWTLMKNIRTQMQGQERRKMKELL